VLGTESRGDVEPAHAAQRVEQCSKSAVMEAGCASNATRHLRLAQQADIADEAIDVD
jgi:hypothetical protein